VKIIANLIMSLTLFGALSSQAGIPLRCPTQSFDYGSGLVSVQGFNCHLGLNYFYILCSGQIVVILMFGAVQALSLQTCFKLGLTCCTIRQSLVRPRTITPLLSRVEVLLRQRVHFGTHNSFFLCVWTRWCLDNCAISDRYGRLPWSTAVEV